MLVDDTATTPVVGCSVDAFEELYKCYYPTVLSFVWRRIGDHATAEDITAQVFMHALTAAARYEERGVPPGAWLLRIAANATTDEQRRRYRLASWSDALLDDAHSTVSTGPTPEDWLAHYERSTWLRSHLGALPTAQRQALVLRFGTGSTMREVALQLKRSEGATKVLVHRALRTLRTRMQPGAASPAEDAVLPDAEYRVRVT